MTTETNEQIIKYLGNYRYQISYRKVNHYMPDDEKAAIGVGGLLTVVGFLLVGMSNTIVIGWLGLVLFMIGALFAFVPFARSEWRGHGYLVALSSIEAATKKKMVIETKYVKKTEDPEFNKSMMRNAVTALIRTATKRLLKEEDEEIEEKTMLEGL